jgi:ribonuclease HI
MMELVLYIDGASKGNPGAAGIGVLVTTPQGEVVTEIGESIGVTTNNVAEYYALLRGLAEAKNRGASRILIHTDSQLLARQMEGRYQVKAAHLHNLYAQAVRLCGEFPDGVRFSHVMREFNRRADQLANQGVRKAADPD